MSSIVSNTSTSRCYSDCSSEKHRTLKVSSLLLVVLCVFHFLSTNKTVAEDTKKFKEMIRRKKLHILVLWPTRSYSNVKSKLGKCNKAHKLVVLKVGKAFYVNSLWPWLRRWDSGHEKRKKFFSPLESLMDSEAFDLFLFSTNDQTRLGRSEKNLSIMGALSTVIAWLRWY